MKKTNRILALLLSLLMCVSLFPAAAFADEQEDANTASFEEIEAEDEPEVEAVPETAEETAVNDAAMSSSGTCGTSLNWVLDDAGTLTISGTGAMYDYQRPELSDDNAPWFPYSESITSVVIENGVTSIGDWAFVACREMVSVTIPDSVTSIGNSAFYVCNGLTGVTIPDSVTSISNSAFYNCSSLKSVTIPSSVTSIGDNVFQYCEGLTKVIFEGSAPTFGNLVFYHDTLTALYPADDDSWASVITAQYGGTVTWLIAGELIASGTCGDNLTWTLDNFGILTISGQGLMWDFDYNNKPWESMLDKIEEVVFETGVTSIGDYSFYWCRSLTGVAIPDSITSIGNSAFMTCSSLTDVTIPDSVTSIGNSAFMGCRSLSSVMIPASVISIEEYTFSGCSSLTEIEVDAENPNYCSVNGILFDKEMKILMMYPAKKPDSFYAIPSGVTGISSDAFCDCENLTSVTISSGVTDIGSGAFCGCSSLTSITIPNSVTSIGSYTFSYCINLTNVIIPDSVTCIGDNAFNNCSSLKSVTFSGNAPAFNIYMFNGDTLTAYYPSGNSTWTSDVMQQYGGTVTWKSYTQGDMNDDGSVNLLDLLLLKRAAEDGDYSALNPAGADVNGSGAIDSNDVVILKNKLAG